MNRRDFVNKALVGVGAVALSAVSSNVVLGSNDNCVCPHCQYDFHISKNDIREMYRRLVYSEMEPIREEVDEKGRIATILGPKKGVFRGWGNRCPRCGKWHRYSNKDMTGVFPPEN